MRALSRRVAPDAEQAAGADEQPHDSLQINLRRLRGARAKLRE
jgi:hypothetical protein